MDELRQLATQSGPYGSAAKAVLDQVRWTTNVVAESVATLSRAASVIEAAQTAMTTGALSREEVIAANPRLEGLHGVLSRVRAR